MKKKLFLIFLNIYLSFLGASGFASTDFEEFKLNTFDGATTFGGQIDFPSSCDQSEFQAVILVGGTGLFYRNTHFGRSGTDRDYIFKDLAERLNKKCIAVVRYDYRGVTCDLHIKKNIPTCLDQRVRKSVTSKTILDDIQAVHDFTVNHPRLDGSQIVFFAHSEGSLNVSRLFARKSINPKGMVFMGGFTESPQSIIKWQFIDRSVEQAFLMDTNNNGVLSNLEILLGYKNSFFANNDISILNLLSPTGFWNRFGLKHFFTLEFNIISALSLNTPDNISYVQKNIIYSSIAWWKEWLRDDLSVLERLKDYEGKVSYFNGSADIMVPGLKQMQYLESFSDQMKFTPEFNLLAGKGHTLNSNLLYGPIDENLVDKIIQTIIHAY